MTLFDFINNSPTQYHAVKNVSDMLVADGFNRLKESEICELKKGGKYFFTRNGSALIAFKVPENNVDGFMICASHSDSPCFKIKENAELKDGNYLKIATEKYGGMINSTWLDRPLGIAGRVTVRTENGIEVKLVNFKTPCAVIPNVAIHFNRSINEGYSYNPATDLNALFSTAAECGFKAVLAGFAGVNESDVVSTDIQLYCAEKAVEFNDLISAPRLDDLQCVYASAGAFISADKNVNAMPILAVFDNEEVGSSTKQGADSSFLNDCITRICEQLGIGASRKCAVTANSFMLSCDNAHAVHPNHPELSDKNNAVKLNGGVVIKYNANQKYTTDAVSSSIVKLLCEKAGVPYQVYANRSDIPGGSTLGNIANTHFSLSTADIGIAQLAMHSAFETAGAKDTEYMQKILKLFFESSVKTDDSGIIIK